jgi:hypothetical protein
MAGAPIKEPIVQHGCVGVAGHWVERLAFSAMFGRLNVVLSHGMGAMQPGLSLIPTPHTPCTAFSWP